MKKLFGMAVLCGLCVCAPAQAADIRLNEVIVSANKIETAASEVTSSVTVISEDDMEAQQARTLVEALQNTPCVFWGSAQGPAGTNSIYLRGSTSRYTQIRYNGIPLREATAIEGNYDAFLGPFHLAPGAISRIEILKGAQGTLYGSSAMGGVVSIYTGNMWDSGFQASLDMSSGSYGTFTASGQVSYGNDKWYVNFTPLYTTSDGFNDIWYDQGGYVLGAGLRISEKTSVELTSMFTAFESAYYDAPRYDSSNKKWSELVVSNDKSLKNTGQAMINGVTVTHEINDTWSVQGKAALTSTERESKADWGNSGFLGNTYYLEVLNTIRPLDNLTIIAGAEYEEQAMELRSSGMTTKDESAGAFSAYAKGLLSFLDKKLVLSAGGRFNKHEEFDCKATWDLGLAYSFDTGTRVFSNVATGFYSPSLYQRYGDGNIYVKGNPDLKAESSISYECGVEQKLWNDKLLISAVAFATEYEDKVEWDPASGWPGSYYNAPEAKARGFELGLSIQPNDSMRFDLGYTHVSSKQKAEGADWAHDVNMPDDKVVGTLYLFPIDELKLSATGRWEDERKDKSGNILDKAFFTMDVAASYDVTEHLQVYAKVNNLLDEDYAVSGWEMPGINAMAGVRYTF